MSILIKGMAMPQNCYECRFMEIVEQHGRERYICIAHLNEITNLKERIETCPLIKIPDHGDLIDRDVVADALDVMAVYGRLQDAFDMVMSCEAVIPAERSEASLCDNCDERSDVGCSWCKRVERSEE